MLWHPLCSQERMWLSQDSIGALEGLIWFLIFTRTFRVLYYFLHFEEEDVEAQKVRSNLFKVAQLVKRQSQDSPGLSDSKVYYAACFLIRLQSDTQCIYSIN